MTVPPTSPHAVANNIRDCSDYWQDMRHSLGAAGIPPNFMSAIGAATGSIHLHNAR